MKSAILFFLFLFLTSCSSEKIKPAAIPQVKAPMAKQKRFVHKDHGDIRKDPFFWLKQRENEEVLNYLHEENRYADHFFAPYRKLKNKILGELKSRIKKKDRTVPFAYKGYEYSSKIEEDQEYWNVSRKKVGSADSEEVIINSNELAKGKKYFNLGRWRVSPDSRYLAYSTDEVGRRIYTIHFKDLKTGKVLPQTIKNVTSSFTWAADGKTLFFVKQNKQTLRYESVYRYDLKTQKIRRVYYEKDLEFSVYVYLSKTENYVYVHSSSTDTDELRLINARQPTQKMKLFSRRKKGVEYRIADAGDHFFVHSNKNARNFKIFKTPNRKQTSSNYWKTYIDHRTDVLVSDMEEFRNHLVLSVRKGGIKQLEVYQRSDKRMHTIATKEKAHVISTSVNVDYNSTMLRYNYQSMLQPRMIIDYDLNSRTQKVLKVREIPGGYDSKLYQSEYLFATAKDGTKIPMSIVYKKGIEKNSKNPVLLYGYGSYGFSMEPRFSSSRLSLLDRGFVYVVAHIRGGSEMGRHWYLDGKKLKKKNTFTDFIACAEHMIKMQWTNSSQLYIQGGSAGGLLMGAVINMRPNLFNGVIAEVPFVDVVTTMLDETIPLTTSEYEEWGNPNIKKYYNYIKSYSPYDNVRVQNYPNLLVKTGLHDSQVQYWEPAKWVAKLRKHKSNNNLLFLKTEMSAGHGGKSGRFKRLEETAENYVFLLALESR